MILCQCLTDLVASVERFPAFVTRVGYWTDTIYIIEGLLLLYYP